MNLVGYTTTALSRNDIIDTPTNKNVVDGAIVELKDYDGNLVTIYDDINGTNPETQKTCDTNGQCTFFAEAGDYVLEVNGRPQNITISVNITVVNDVSSQRIWGDRYKGEITDDVGVTLTDEFSVLLYDGSYYSYTGSDPFPVIVTSGTVPTAPDYKLRNPTDHDSDINRNAVGAHDDIYSREYETVSDLVGQTESHKIGNTYLIKNYYSDIKGGGKAVTISNVAPSVGLGTIHHALSGGLYAIFKPESPYKIKASQAGARFDGTTDDFPYFEAIKDAGFRTVILGIGETLWSARLIYEDFNNLRFVGAGNTKFEEIAGYQPHISQITPTFDSTEPLLDIRGGVNNSVKGVSFIAGQSVRNSYSGAALRNYRGSGCNNRNVTSSGFKLGQVLAGHIYGVQSKCFSENGQDGFAYESVAGVSQTNICQSYGCRVRQVHTGFAVDSTTAIELSSPAGEVISDQYSTDRVTDSAFILDFNNKNLSITGTAYLEGSDRFITAPQSNPSVGTVISNFYYRNPKSYVLSGLLQDFGILSANTKILSGYIAETTNYSGSGLPVDGIGRIRPKNNCEISGVTGGFVEIDASTDVSTLLLSDNNFGVDRFDGIFYLAGANSKLRYNSPSKKVYHAGNLEVTLNASGYVDVNTGLGVNKTGSLMVQAYVTQNTNGDIVTSFQDGTETVRLYIRTASGALVTSTTRRINLTVEVVENF